jgi:hypothetical protein
MRGLEWTAADKAKEGDSTDQQEEVVSQASEEKEESRGRSKRGDEERAGM